MLLRVIALFSLLTVILLAIGFYFAGIAGMIIALVFAFIMNFVSYWYSDRIVLGMYRAKRLDERDAPEIAHAIEKLAEKAGIAKPRLYKIDMPIPNAFATGRNPRNSAIVVTNGLMTKLDVDEIEGVLAHEIAHVKHRDTLLQTVAATIAGAIAWLGYMFLFSDPRNRNALSIILVFVLLPLAATLIRLAISRNREFNADKIGGELSDPLKLASALHKISEEVKHVRIRGNPSSAHLFIVNPFSSGSLLKLFSTHPPIEERIARLRQMAI